MSWQAPWMRALSPPTPPPKGAVYAGLFLDEPSRRRLLAAFPPVHPTVFADHVTLAFGKAMRPDGYPLGETRRLFVTGIGEDFKGQVVLVDPASMLDLLAPGQTPHITISTAAGVPPVYAKELAAKSAPTPRRLELTGVIDYFPRSPP